jgi:plastocyanin domain-containing protein
MSSRTPIGGRTLRRAAATATAAGLQEIQVVVKGGYAPDVIVVKQNQPVRLDFYRDETASCSEQLRLPDFGIARDLPAFTTTPVEFTPDKPGEFTFTCGMNMMRGKIIVERR